MLNASDDILNQINCTDSSGEDGVKSPNQPKIRSCSTWNPPSLSTLLPHQRLTPPSQGQFTSLFFTIPPLKFPLHNYPSPPLEEFPPTSDVFREFLEHHYQQAWVILETEDSNQKIRKSDSVLASDKKVNAAL